MRIGKGGDQESPMNCEIQVGGGPGGMTSCRDRYLRPIFGGRLGKMVKSVLGVVVHTGQNMGGRHSVGLEYKFGVLIWSGMKSSRMAAVLLLSCTLVPAH